MKLEPLLLSEIGIASKISTQCRYCWMESEVAKQFAENLDYTVLYPEVKYTCLIVGKFNINYIFIAFYFYSHARRLEESNYNYHKWRHINIFTSKASLSLLVSSAPDVKMYGVWMKE